MRGGSSVPCANGFDCRLCRGRVYLSRFIDLVVVIDDWLTERLALQRFEHPLPLKPQDSPHPWTPLVYGAKVQLTPLPDASNPLEATACHRIQEILGTLLFYARAVDDTLLMAINSLAAEQNVATRTTMDKAVNKMILYCLPPHARNPKSQEALKGMHLLS